MPGITTSDKSDRNDSVAAKLTERLIAAASVDDLVAELRQRGLSHRAYGSIVFDQTGLSLGTRILKLLRRACHLTAAGRAGKHKWKVCQRPLGYQRG